MSPSTRESPPRIINWLFSNQVNVRRVVHSIDVPGHPRDPPVEKLEWVAALKKHFDFRVKESTILFWQPCDPVSRLSTPLYIKEAANWMGKNTDIEKAAEICQPASTVSDALGESWDHRHVHFIITAEEFVEDADTMAAKEVEHVPELPELPLHAMHRRLQGARTQISAPPSTAATSREYAKLQKNPRTAIYDGFFAHKRGSYLVTIAPPVQIFHPVFQEFSDRLGDSTFKPDDDVLSATSKLISMTAEISSSEREAADKLSHLLTVILGRLFVKVESVGGRIPDGLVYKELEQFLVPLICFEYKRAFGEGGCDALTQAEFSLRDFLVSKKFKPVFEKCCCPSFIIAGGGPYLSILGAVFTDKFVVQRLTNIMWVGEASTQEDAWLYQLARTFTSLRLALEALDKYYDQIYNDNGIPALEPNKPHPRLFPYPTKFQEYCTEVNAQSTTTNAESKTADAKSTTTDVESTITEFEYIDAFRADPTNVTFLAKVKSPDSDRKLVVKFVDRYGVGAHELLAKEGMAPKLLYCGLLDGNDDVRNTKSRARGSTETGGLYVGPPRMVVMEYIDGETMVDPSSALPKDAREQIKNAIQKLHDAKFVFGDLRSPNVMFSKDKAFLIDFDWAGEENEVRYPRNLSRRVKWPEQAEKLEMKPIKSDHDITMLNQLFSK